SDAASEDLFKLRNKKSGVGTKKGRSGSGSAEGELFCTESVVILQEETIEAFATGETVQVTSGSIANVDNDADGIEDLRIGSLSLKLDDGTYALVEVTGDSIQFMYGSSKLEIFDNTFEIKLNDEETAVEYQMSIFRGSMDELLSVDASHISQAVRAFVAFVGENLGGGRQLQRRLEDDCDFWRRFYLIAMASATCLLTPAAILVCVVDPTFAACVGIPAAGISCINAIDAVNQCSWDE
ncbi:hypothetical protein ACHAWF_007556, partial [Thalassiosira exigua]